MDDPAIDSGYVSYMDVAVSNIQDVVTGIDVFNATLNASKAVILDYEESITPQGQTIDQLTQEAITISQNDTEYLDGEGR